MRGSPPLQLALLLVGFFLLAVPLMQLTSGREHSAPPQPTAVDASSVKVQTTLRLQYAHKPSSLSLKLGAVELLTAADLSSSPVEASVAIAIPKDGIELLVSAQWLEGTPDTALTVQLEPDELDAQSQTRWSAQGTLAETLLFQWKP